MASSPADPTAGTDAGLNRSQPCPGRRARAGLSYFGGVIFRCLLRIGRDLLIVYLGTVVIAMFLENSLIFFPARYPEGDWRPAGLEFEDVFFQSGEGTPLHGWYVPCKTPRGVVLFCHGNAGNITHREEIIRRLRDVSGVTVFIFDYRGYGRSEGKPSGQGVLDDARVARAWLARREGIAEDRLILMGESLGGAVAVDLAAEKGARGLILESTFTSLADVGAYHYPWLPVRVFLRTRLDSLGKIKNYRGPLFQSHGDADTIVPFKFGRALFDAANEPKQWITAAGADHNDLRSRQYYERLGQFVAGLK